MIFDATVAGRTARVEVRGRNGRYTVVIDGEPLDVDFQPTGASFASVIVTSGAGAKDEAATTLAREVGLERTPTGYRVVLADDALDVELHSTARGADLGAKKGAAGPAKLNAPMPGRIVKILAAEGDEVTAGQGLVVMEAMKMENELRAPRAGRISKVAVAERQNVETGALLVVVE